MISRCGVSPDPNKVAAIRDLPNPTTVTGVRTLHGMANYYRKFIPRFSEIPWPLYSLTKKHADIIWTDECQVAFDTLKAKLLSPNLALQFPDISNIFIL